MSGTSGIARHAASCASSSGHRQPTGSALSLSARTSCPATGTSDSLVGFDTILAGLEAASANRAHASGGR
jgi:hypothetical protein